MAEYGISIVKMDVEKLITLLNKALADEWLAYYQYWIGAKVVTGPMKDAVIHELEEHAEEELNHADMLVERILQLGGTPVLSPDAWPKIANCDYEVPEDPYVAVILDQNIKGEQCAIKVYNELLEITKDTDPITYHLVLQILTEEVEHEEDLAALKEDYNLRFERK